MPENLEPQNIKEAIEDCSISDDFLKEKEHIDSVINSLKIRFIAMKMLKEKK